MDLLSYQKGGILFSNCQTLVNPVSCDGTIDSYLSKRFFMRYPAMYTKYLQFCKEKQFTPGKLWVYQGKTKNILNFRLRGDCPWIDKLSWAPKMPRTIWALLRGLARTDDGKVRLLFALCKSLGRKVMIWRLLLTVVECLDINYS